MYVLNASRWIFSTRNIRETFSWKYFRFFFCCPKMAEKPSTSDQAQIVNIIAEEGDEYLVVRIEVTLCDCPNCLQEETTF